MFICSPSDPATKICKASDADTITVPWEPDGADFAKKINRAYELLESEWYFQGATDLVFHPKWAWHAMRVAEQQRVGVVGTNDLGNPAVKRGNQATHILFSREYIETHGGTLDDTGAVFSEAYDHQFVDTEFVEIARLRKQFHPAIKSIVEHMHPHWGKGETDATYEKSERLFRDDQRLFVQRMRAINAALGGGRYRIRQRSGR